MSASFTGTAFVGRGRLERRELLLVVFDDDTARTVPGQSHRMFHDGAKNPKPENQRYLFGTDALLARAVR